MARKNITVMTAEITGASTPILAKMKGRVSYTSAGPADGSIPAENTAGMIANPAIMAKMVSETAVKSPPARMLFSFFIKDEYTSTAPIPSDMLKKAWPRAHAHPLASSLEKSG